MSEEKAYAEELVRKEETAHGEGETEETNGGETVPEEEHEEKNVQKEEPLKEAVRTEEKAEEDVLTGKGSEENLPAEEQMQGTVQLEEAVWKKEAAGEMTRREEDAAEEIIYTEGEGMEEMTEQEYETVEENRLKTDSFEEEPKKRGIFRRSKEEANFLRDKWILSRIRDEDLMDYLVLEQKRNEQLQKARDIRERRLVSAFKLTVSLAAGVAVVYFLKDNPTIFVNILYIGGILGGFWFWKNPREK